MKEHEGGGDYKKTYYSYCHKYCCEESDM